MKLFSAIKSVERICKSKCLSCEGEIITFLFENGPSRSGQIVKYSRHSHVQVYNKIKYLSDQGVIARSFGNGSGVNLYTLNPNIIEIFENIILNSE